VEKLTLTKRSETKIEHLDCSNGTTVIRVDHVDGSDIEWFNVINGNVKKIEKTEALDSAIRPIRRIDMPDELKDIITMAAFILLFVLFIWSMNFIGNL
jgi:hypothetical protein